MVGCGFFGRIQMEAWQRVEGARMVAACDLDREKTREFADAFGVQAYADLGAMIEEQKPDFLDIATRPSTHLPLVRAVLAHGIPILLQKPLAETWSEARAICKLADEARVRMMVNENWRWQRWYREIAALIGGGKIGSPFYYSMQARARDGLGPNPFPNQPYFKDMPRFLLMETLVHHLDTARSLLGPIEEVYCQTAKLNPVMAAEDLALIMTRHASGVRGMIDANRACEPDEPGQALEVARFEGLEGHIRLQHSGDVWLDDAKVFKGEGQPGYRGDSCRATQQHFIDCLQKGDEFETEAADYLNKTFAVVEACYLSAERNQPVEVREIHGRE